MTVPKPKTVDDYILSKSPEAQKKLNEIRAILKKVSPKGKESIKWGSPVIEEDRILFAFTAFKTHLNFMPTRTTLEHFNKELADYKTGKDTIQFTYDEPLPKELIKKIALHRARDVRKNDAKWMISG